jgi:hypothetical protein
MASHNYKSYRPKNVPRYHQIAFGHMSEDDLMAAVMPVKDWRLLQQAVQMVMDTGVFGEDSFFVEELNRVHDAIDKELEINGWPG